MRKWILILLIGIGAKLSAQQEQGLAFAATHLDPDSSRFSSSFTSSLVKSEFAGFTLYSVLSNNKAVAKTLGFSQKGKAIPVYYFPGTSSQKALVIGGVHGSELSAVEVAKELIHQLQKGEKPYYTVIVVPLLFPDNAEAAASSTGDRVQKNAGRYTTDDAIDPNRQMPALGQPFLLNKPLDAYGRAIEAENRLLLQLIQAYAPDRIINLHAIKDAAHAGVYADPRTDCEGRALGFTSDSALAVSMAQYIETNGGASPGNNLSTAPTALYYLDPKPVVEGTLQPRNLCGMNKRGKIAGVSLGSWASTAVCDEAIGYRRPAMRLFTMEFPGYKKPSEYSLRKDYDWFSKQVVLYAGAIRYYFLEAYSVEEKPLEEEAWAQKKPTGWMDSSSPLPAAQRIP